MRAPIRCSATAARGARRAGGQEYNGSAGHTPELAKKEGEQAVAPGKNARNASAKRPRSARGEAAAPGKNARNASAKGREASAPGKNARNASARGRDARRKGGGAEQEREEREARTEKREREGLIVRATSRWHYDSAGFLKRLVTWKPLLPFQKIPE